MIALEAAASPSDLLGMPGALPPPTRPGDGRVRWDAVVGTGALLVATLVAVCVPESDITLRTVQPAPSQLPATSQPDPAHWPGGRQDP